MSILSNLKPPAGAKREPMRVGRGPGSGKGKTCGRGMNGQRSRSGSGGRSTFEGGQMPIYRRLPKRGFNNPCAARVVNVNVGTLEVFDAGTEVTLALLKARGLVKGRFDAVKILGNGELTKKLTVQAQAFSAGASEKIAKSGGKAAVVASVAAGATTSTPSKTS